MEKVQASEPGTEQQTITLLTRSATKMEMTPHSSEILPAPGTYEQDYIDFIDLASHELDAPLRKLALFTGRLNEKLDLASQNKDVQAYLERMNNCVEDMRSIVDGISVLAKTASEKREYQRFNPEVVIQQVIESLGVPIKAANATIDVSPLPLLEGDAAQFFRLFKSLLENAIKFADENIATNIFIRSSVADAAETERFKLPAGQVYHRIEIADNGIGFKSEYAEKIFRPFVRLHGKSRFAGNGLGLAICKKIVENHHGIIYADSKEKEGSRFILLLPQML